LFVPTSGTPEKERPGFGRAFSMMSRVSRMTTITRAISRATLVFATVVVSAVPVLAQENGSFGAEPVAVGANNPGYFILEAEPGRTYERAIRVSNPSNRPVELVIAGVDADTALYGGVDYALAEDEQTRVGTWIEVSEDRIRLAPGAAEEVPFVVDVPADAGSGQHVGGVAIGQPAEQASEQQQAGDNEAGAAVVVRSRRVIAVQVDLPGDSAPVLQVDRVEAAARADGVYLEMNISNVGRGLTTASGVVTVPETGFERSFDIDTFVPGTSIAYPVRWADAPDSGEYTVSVRLEYEGGPPAEYAGTFEVGGDVQRELADRGVGPAAVNDGGTGDDGALTPLALGGLVVAAAGAGAGAVFFVRRRRARAAAGPDAATAADSPVAPSDPTPPVHDERSSEVAGARATAAVATTPRTGERAAASERKTAERRTAERRSTKRRTSEASTAAPTTGERRKAERRTAERRTAKPRTTARKTPAPAAAGKGSEEATPAAKPPTSKTTTARTGASAKRSAARTAARTAGGADGAAKRTAKKASAADDRDNVKKTAAVRGSTTAKKTEASNRGDTPKRTASAGGEGAAKKTMAKKTAAKTASAKTASGNATSGKTTAKKTNSNRKATRAGTPKPVDGSSEDGGRP